MIGYVLMTVLVVLTILYSSLHKWLTKTLNKKHVNIDYTHFADNARYTNLKIIAKDEMLNPKEHP